MSVMFSTSLPLEGQQDTHKETGAISLHVCTAVVLDENCTPIQAHILECLYSTW